MIKTYTDGKNVFTYDTKKIKGYCVDCNQEISGDKEKNYQDRGNYCSSCNSKYSQ